MSFQKDHSLENEPSFAFTTLLKYLTPERNIFLEEMKFTFGFSDPKIYGNLLNNCPNISVLSLVDVTNTQFASLRLSRVKNLTVQNIVIRMNATTLAKAMLGINYTGEPIYHENSEDPYFSKLEKIHLMPRSLHVSNPIGVP